MAPSFTQAFTRLSRTSTALAALLALAGICSALPAQAELLVRRDLGTSSAVLLAQAAIDSCKASGYAVSAVVVDRGGNTQVAIRGDNASGHTMENARRKAYTALVFKTTTTEYAKRYADNNPLVHQQVTLPNVIAIPGGMPIKVGTEVIGGIGVSGSPGVDDGCVQAGLDRIADQLK